jgi:hypothetical protein
MTAPPTILELESGPAGAGSVVLNPIVRRVWATPSANTFDVKPIRELVKMLLSKSKVSIDPMARNRRWCTHTNDLNPATQAMHHMDAYDYLLMLEKEKVSADLVILDPPYGPRQIVDFYAGLGIDAKTVAKVKDRLPTQRAAWKAEKDIIARLQPPGGIVCCCGWNSGGMGIGRKYELLELLVVCHGGSRNDTLVTVERKAQNGKVSHEGSAAKDA